MVVVVIFGVVMVLYVLLFAVFIIGSSLSMFSDALNDNHLATRRGNRHKSYDFYDEPDGFYVTMGDGSIRIDD